jgi:hypothetical protein
VKKEEAISVHLVLPDEALDRIADLVVVKLRESGAASFTVEPEVGAAVAAAHIGVKENTLRSWASTRYKNIPIHKYGKSVRFKLSELEEWGRLNA